MTLGRRYLPAGHQRSLGGCCRSVGIPLTNAHSALGDARATAALLQHYLDLTPAPSPGSALLRDCARLAWPALPRTAFTPVTRSPAGETEEHLLDRIVERLPADVEPYLAVLDRALLDRHVAATEANELVEPAQYLGLSRATVAQAHRRYLAAVADAAWGDATVSDDEMADLRSVARILKLAPGAVEEELHRAATVRAAGTPPRSRGPSDQGRVGGIGSSNTGLQVYEAKGGGGWQ
ncbi:hypothetical protein GCM10009834_39410 [Streptomonospora arabica]